VETVWRPSREVWPLIDSAATASLHQGLGGLPNWSSALPVVFRFAEALLDHPPAGRMPRSQGQGRYPSHKADTLMTRKRSVVEVHVDLQCRTKRYLARMANVCLEEAAAGCLASRFHAKARGATIRAGLIDVAARLARRGRGQLTLHLPQYWHRQSEWLALFEAACGPPPRAA